MAQEKHHMVSPSASALMALAVVCFCFFALLNGYVSGGAVILIACIMIAATIPQLIAAIFDSIEGNSLFGNLLMYFACFFMLGTGLTMLAEYLCGMLGWPLDTKILGWVWVILAIALWGFTPGILGKAPWHLGVGILFGDVALLLLALSYWGMGGPIMHPLAAWLIAILGVIGLYNGVATVLAETFQRPVLPIGKPLIK